jgi:tetratricopeptide (TPR) repeat protein
MSSIRIQRLTPVLLAAALAAACAGASKRIDEHPITIMRNGDRVGPPTRATDAATTMALEAGIEGRERRDSIAALAYASCAPVVCAALGRGEVALGMTEAQVFAATRTSDLAWTARHSGGVAVLAPRDLEAGPRDAVAPIALVQLAGGTVASLTYREPQGLRTVTNASDVTDANRARAVALAREGDALAAAGDFTAALERYDRASVVDRADAELQYKMATSLDKLLRPVEAELRYRLFLHQLELQKIDAYGNANAKLADAIAQARERIIVLDRQSR